MHYLELITKFCSKVAENSLFLNFCYYFSFLFSGELFVVSYVFALLVSGILVFLSSSKERLNLYNRVFDFFAKLGIIFLVFVIVYWSIKFFTSVPRPNNSSDLTSFPSAHSGLASLLAFHFYKYFSKTFVAIAILLILINAIVMLTLDCHRLPEIICGILLAPIVRLVGMRLYAVLSFPIQKVKDWTYNFIFYK